MLDSISQIFTRDLNRLKKEITSYSDENLLWETNQKVSNSSGNLCLHLIGNLNHFIGTILGNSEYIREREVEFSAKHIPIKDLLSQIDNTILVVDQTLSNLSEKDLKSPFPIEVFGHEMTTEFFLLHLSSHLNYHLGQINYHKRLM